MKKDKNKTVGFGFVGRWSDGTLGWSAPRHIQQGRYSINKPTLCEWNKGEPHYKCKITVELVTDKNGKPITRYLK